MFSWQTIFLGDVVCRIFAVKSLLVVPKDRALAWVSRVERVFEGRELLTRGGLLLGGVMFVALAWLILP